MEGVGKYRGIKGTRRMLGGGRDVEGWRNRDGEMETRDKDREQGD